MKRGIKPSESGEITVGKIGLYGGSFNPPHLGHIKAAQHVKELLNLDQILMMPAKVPPHKTLPPHTPDGEMRYRMLQIALSHVTGIQACDWELQRNGLSYTVETLYQLHREFPEDELYLLMGTDMFLSFSQWYRADEICKLAVLVTFARSDGDKKQKEEIERLAQFYRERYQAKVCLVPHKAVDVSSTQVRRLLAFGCADAYLHPDVLKFIEKNSFYYTGGTLQKVSLGTLQEVSYTLADTKRIAHIAGCVDMAVRLAECYDADAVLAQRAALLHDITKPVRPADQLLLCERYGIILSNFEEENPQLLHAKTGAAVAKAIFGECDEVCKAIQWHTTGKENMGLLDKILYLADFIEPSRNFEGIASVRKLAFENLDEALLQALQLSINFLKEKGKSCDPNSQRAEKFLLSLKQKGN